MRRLFIVRHAEKLAKARETYRENYYARLTRTGTKQATALADQLSSVKKDLRRIYSSPQPRARRTAEILAKRLNARVVTVPDLRERLLSRRRHDTDLKKWWEKSRQDWNFAAPEGESVNMAIKRFLGALRKIEKKEDAEEVLIVTHGRVTQFALAKLFPKLKKRLDPKRFSLDETAVTVLRSHSGKFRLLRLNDTGHLPPSLRQRKKVQNKD